MITRAKVELGLRIKKIVWLRISLVTGKILFVKCNQTLIEYLKKINCYVLCSLRVLFCLKKANPSLEISIRFN